MYSSWNAVPPLLAAKLVSQIKVILKRVLFLLINKILINFWWRTIIEISHIWVNLVDLFSGIGGFAIGFENSGFEIW